jgi:hypothetical protein
MNETLCLASSQHVVHSIAVGNALLSIDPDDEVNNAANRSRRRTKQKWKTIIYCLDYSKFFILVSDEWCRRIESYNSYVDDDKFDILMMSEAATALIDLCQASKAPKVATKAITLDEVLANEKKYWSRDFAIS